MASIHQCLEPGRRAGHVEPPAAVRQRHQDRPLERLGAERLAVDPGDRLERHAVARARHLDGDSAAGVDRPTHPVGQPEHPVDEYGARRARPVPGPASGAGTTTCEPSKRGTARSVIVGMA